MTDVYLDSVVQVMSKRYAESDLSLRMWALITYRVSLEKMRMTFESQSICTLGDDVPGNCCTGFNFFLGRHMSRLFQACLCII